MDPGGAPLGDHVAYRADEERMRADARIGRGGGYKVGLDQDPVAFPDERGDPAERLQDLQDGAPESGRVVADSPLQPDDRHASTISTATGTFKPGNPHSEGYYPGLPFPEGLL